MFGLPAREPDADGTDSALTVFKVVSLSLPERYRWGWSGQRSAVVRRNHAPRPVSLESDLSVILEPSLFVFRDGDLSDLTILGEVLV